jgi:dihydrofolate synthase/folylpolyglutamate synthase
LTESSATLQAWLSRIESIHPVKWDLGLDRVRAVAQRLGLLKPAPKTILIAGTNGKGSTCEYLTRLAMAAGLKVGTSTSPHLHRFNERIVVNGQSASDEEIVAAFEQIDNARVDETLTYFEFATLASLSIFKARGVDLAILEIGLGGRLDAMNIVMPDLSIINSISLDHQSYLGDTRDEIGREKAGIMRAGIPCIVSDREPPLSLLQHAEEVGAPLKLIGESFDIQGDSVYFTLNRTLNSSSLNNGAFNNGALNNGALNTSALDHTTGDQSRTIDKLPALRLPAPSFAAAVQAAMELGLTLGDDAIRQVASDASLPGRAQWFDVKGFDVKGLEAKGLEEKWPKGMGPVLLDVAHNLAAAESFQAYVMQHLPRGQVYALVGMYGDKDVEAVLATFEGIVNTWHFVDMDDPRAAAATDLKAKLHADYKDQASTYANIYTALESLTSSATKEDLLLVFGSFPVVAGALQTLQTLKGTS